MSVSSVVAVDCPGWMKIKSPTLAFLLFIDYLLQRQFTSTLAQTDESSPVSTETLRK